MKIKQVLQNLLKEIEKAALVSVKLGTSQLNPSSPVDFSGNLSVWES